MYTWALLPILGLRWHFSEITDLIQMKHMGHPISKVLFLAVACIPADCTLLSNVLLPSFNQCSQPIHNLVSTRSEGAGLTVLGRGGGEQMAAGEARLALMMRAVFVLRFYLLPLLLRPSLHTLACTIVCTCAGSLCAPAPPSRPPHTAPARRPRRAMPVRRRESAALCGAA
jgi:hypothetical protein